MAQVTTPEQRAYMREYHRRRKAAGYKRIYTPEQYARHKERGKKWRAGSKERTKGRTQVAWRRYMYKLEPETYDALFAKQDGMCALLCGRPIECVDHDHHCCSGAKSCGKCVRGLLCKRCNAAIGSLNEDFELLLRAAKYLVEARINAVTSDSE